MSELETRTPNIKFTETAYSKLAEVVDNHPNPVAGLRLEIAERSGGQFKHLLSLVEQGAELEADVEVETTDGISVFVPSHDLAYVEGLEIHFFSDEEGNQGLEFRNPNPIWSDPREFAIQDLFDEHLNPQIGSHGGTVKLLGVQGRTAYVEFGGGCVGCGMATATLKQGVEAAVKQQVPDIEEVTDVTDHASGTNPYYKPSGAHGHAHAHAH
ncbi:MAG: NifU family protein [Dehalococcoidia bacterium]|nr:NifU family protein [Dehalococcoidia bacterium]